MSELIKEANGSGRLLYDALHRCSHFDWETHMRWLHDRSLKIKALNKKFPPNCIYKVSDQEPAIPGAIAYIDGYTESTIGVTPIGTTFVARVRPDHLMDVTIDVKNGNIKEEDVVAMLAKWAVPPENVENN